MEDVNAKFKELYDRRLDCRVGALWGLNVFPALAVESGKTP